jgi:hypothetical protein
MLTADETVRTVPGFGVAHRVTTRTWRLLGGPVTWMTRTERG